MDRYRVPPNTRALLAERDPSERLTFDGGKKLGREYLRELTTRLGDLQELLYAEGKHRILMVLQATDAGGKDGVIRHVSKAEQAARLQDRLDDPAKHWKFSPADLAERKHWDAYQQAYEAMLSQTSTTWAPWYVVPSNSKWYRNLVIARLLVETLEGLGMSYPERDFDPAGIRIE